MIASSLPQDAHAATNLRRVGQLEAERRQRQRAASSAEGAERRARELEAAGEATRAELEAARADGREAK